METTGLLTLARKLMDELTFCVAATQSEDGATNARIVQPLPVGDDWTVNFLTNRRCRKTREIQRTGRMTLLYQHDADKSYVTLIGRAVIVEDVDLKRTIWQPGHDRWNEGGPENPATVFARLVTDRIEIWSAVHGVLPDPAGYSASVLTRCDGNWERSTT